MNEAAKAARREYKRNWQRKNRDKVKKYQEDYWNRKAQEAAAATQTAIDRGKTRPAQED